MDSEQYMDDPIFDAYAPMIREWDERTKVPPDGLPGGQLSRDGEAQTPELAWLPWSRRSITWRPY